MCTNHKMTIKLIGQCNDELDAFGDIVEFGHNVEIIFDLVKTNKSRTSRRYFKVSASIRFDDAE